MKIAVYAICKNENKHIARWVNSMDEADSIYVTDTGSDDDSIEKLKNLNVNVQSIKLNRFRFDDARNASLNFVPNNFDVCVCTDLDEVFLPGWRAEVENEFAKQQNLHRLHYKFVTSVNHDGTDGQCFYNIKIHKRHGYKWKHPVHEIVEYIGLDKENIAVNENIKLYHYPDISKPREYLNLLEIGVKEDPTPRNLHYLCREYWYLKKWEDCIKAGLAHLNTIGKGWLEEYPVSMRYIATAYKELGNYYQSEKYLIKAIELIPNRREPYIELSILYKLINKNILSKWALDSAAKIKEKHGNYIHEGWAWNNSFIN